MKEGNAIEDFLNPERIIIGSSDKRAAKKVEDLFATLKIPVDKILHMSNLSAELTKYAANSFLATKIAFINEMSNLCEVFGADIQDLRRGLACDSRIGPHALTPGPGFGGVLFT